MKKNKTKRIKRVFSTCSQVAGLWAKQSQDSARCKNAFFEGRDLYSYHYLLGRLVRINGLQVAAIQGTGYSKTTHGHSWDAARASRNAGVLYVKYSGTGYLAASSTDAEVIQAVRSYLESESARLWRDAGETLCMASAWHIRYTKNEIKDHNETCIKLGFRSLVVTVPDSHWRQCRDLAKARENAAANYGERTQDDLFEAVLKEPVYITRYVFGRAVRRRLSHYSNQKYTA